MKFQASFLALAVAGIGAAQAQGLNRTDHAAHPVQATCSQGSGEKQLARVNQESIGIRSGSASRSVALSDIQSIDVTGPVNRISRYAWVTVKTSGGDTEKVGLDLPDRGTLVLDGVTAQGKPDSIDVLDCKSIQFKAG